MSPVEQARHWKSRPPVRRGAPAAAALLLVLAGCAGDGRNPHDPFLGTPSPAPAASTASTTPTGGNTATAPPASAAVPPLPGTHTQTSPAALAGGTTPAPEGVRDLRISGGAPVVPASLPGGGAVRGAAPGVQVGEPTPAAESTSSRLMPVAATGSPPPSAAPGTSPPPAAATGATSFEQAQQFLKQRGVTWQRLETAGEPGQWKFQCSLPIPGSTNINRTYVTDSPLPDPLAAIRAVLDKIEKDQQR